VGGGAFAQGNCENFSLYPGVIIPDALGALTTISTCSFESEYSQVTNIIAGAAYQFTHSTGGYITVRQDVPGGTVIGQGYSPVTVAAVTAGDLFPHWTIDDACNTQSNCIVTTVQLFLNCTPASATYSIIDDCTTNSFTIELNILSTGDGAIVNVDQIVNGGVPTTFAGQGVGTIILGPFVVGDQVDVILNHELDPLCNVSFFGLESTGNCPVILTCGGVEYSDSYCYTGPETKTWWYQNTGTEPLALLFSSGFVESNTWDQLTIYDGPNDFGTPIYTNPAQTTDLAGTLVITTGQNLFMKLVSDFSVSCDNQIGWEWNWTVGCLDCDVPAGTFNVVPDCIHREYSLEVNVTSTGDAATVDLILPGDTLTGLGLGLQTFGPIPMDSTVNLGLYNGDNNLCRIFSGPLVAFEDSCIIPACENVNQNYCYMNDDDAWFVYQSTDPNIPISIDFIQGELLVDDKIVIYNGPYDQSAVLFNGNLGGNLAGFSINSQNPDNILTLRVQSNSTASCLDGQATYDMWWDVGCGLVGVDETTGEGFTIYPNPTNGTITVQLGSDDVTSTLVRLLDVSGREVYAEAVRAMNGRSFQLDLSDLQSGNYFLQLNTDQWVRTQAVQVGR